MNWPQRNLRSQITVKISGEDPQGGRSQALDLSLSEVGARGEASQALDLSLSEVGARGEEVKLLTCHFRGDLGQQGGLPHNA